MPEEFYDEDFPNLNGRFKKTSHPAYYNCIAYIVGDLRRKWWPDEDDYPPGSPDYWPLPPPVKANLEAFIAALATVQYEQCADGNYESGFEKAAIYALDSSVTHAALQREDGEWRSKLGSDEDIEHPLDGLEGGRYGKIIAYVKRPRMALSDPKMSTSEKQRLE